MGQLFLGSRVPPWDLSAWESQGVKLLRNKCSQPPRYLPWSLQLPHALGAM